MKDGKVSVLVHGRGNPGAKPHSEVIAEILTAIEEQQLIQVTPNTAAQSAHSFQRKRKRVSSN